MRGSAQEVALQWQVALYLGGRWNAGLPSPLFPAVHVLSFTRHCSCSGTHVQFCLSGWKSLLYNLYKCTSKHEVEEVFLNINYNEKTPCGSSEDPFH